MNMSVVRLLFFLARLSFLFSTVCFNSFYLAEARSQTGKRPLGRSIQLRASGSAATVQGQTGKRPLVQPSELKEATAEQGNRNFTLQREQKELRARGVVVRFHLWPSTKQREKVAGILRTQGLKKTRSIKDFKAQLFEWKEGGLKPSGQAERSCVRIRGLSYVRRCSPDHLLPVNASKDFSRQGRGTLPDGYIEQDRQSRTEADFFECKDCKEDQGLESIAKLLNEVVGVRTCRLIPAKQELMYMDEKLSGYLGQGMYGRKLSDYWAQELTGSDLLREELKKTDPPDIENWIAVFDNRDENHNIHVRNLISDDGAHAVLPELTDRKNPFVNVHKEDQPLSEYKEGKRYKSSLALYETSYPGDYLFGFKNRAPHYINNSMRWRNSKDIYEVFEKLSSAKISMLVVVTATGNDFPYRLDDTKAQASRGFDSGGEFFSKGICKSVLSIREGGFCSGSL